jgi:S-adenosylmethionine synthetase
MNPTRVQRWQWRVMEVKVVEAPFAVIDEFPFEVVERKGLGHPDTICDAIAETASRRYSQYFQERFGRLAHHWFDKVMLLGGEARIQYGHGELTRPYQLIFAGKGVLRVGDFRIPIEEILENASTEVLTQVLRNFDPLRDLVIKNEIKDYIGPTNRRSRYMPTDPMDLVDPRQQRLSNDCNVCSGYAPLSLLEKSILGVEHYLNSQDYKTRFVDTGTDVKIVGIRKGSDIEIVVNIPLIAAEIKSYEQYKQRILEIHDDITRLVRDELLRNPAKITINPEDVSGLPYLTVTGSVADTGDIGVVGRGNRRNGLITPMRPMSIEAAAGKNPIDHTGKLYSILAQRIADKVYQHHGLRNQAHVITFKERPIEDPQEVVVYYHTDPDRSGNPDKLGDLIRKEVAEVYTSTDALVGPGLELW